MTKRRFKKPVEGDVFEMTLPGDVFGYGQLVRGGKTHFYISVLRTLFPSHQPVENLDLSDVLLIGRSMDALIYHGRWAVIGNRPVPEGLPYPNARVGIDGAQHIVDFDHKIIRRATDEDIQHYDLASSRAPIAYQNALLAFHGLAEMQDHYQRLFREYAEAQARLRP